MCGINFACLRLQLKAALSGCSFNVRWLRGSRCVLRGMLQDNGRMSAWQRTGQWLGELLASFGVQMQYFILGSGIWHGQHHQY